MPDFTTFSVLFFVRKTSADTSKFLIYARITVDGKRAEISLKRSIPVNKWDPKGKRKRIWTRCKSIEPVLRPGLYQITGMP